VVILKLWIVERTHTDTSAGEMLLTSLSHFFSTPGGGHDSTPIAAFCTVADELSCQTLGFLFSVWFSVCAFVFYSLFGEGDDGG